MTRNNRRVDYNQERTKAYLEYENGSAVRVIEEQQTESPGQRVRKEPKRAAKRRAGNLSRGYVLFLTMICIAVSVNCVVFLKQKATITGQYEAMAQLESEYNRIKNDNDAKYNQVIGSVSMEDVKEVAEKKLNMHYADSDQIIYYDLTDGSYVRQYKDVPAE